MNRRTGKFVYGTDRRYSPPHQLTSDSQALTFPTERKAKLELEFRECSKDYIVVPVTLRVGHDI